MELIEGQQKKEIKEKMDDLEANFGGVDSPYCSGIISAGQYDPGYCDILLNAMRCGLDKKGAAGAIGISHETFEKWEADHKEFAEAVKVGKSLFALFWQKQGIKNLVYSPTGKQINSKIYSLAMQAHFGWGDSKEESKKEMRVLAFELTNKPKLEKE